ncbi:HAMP domain-containing sensor histidine kinase [Clostridium ihumii]|uniref:HAMP domain-containing sensor histidine kinase n=1 Tax=Clostridium ihumii TaxID=1470356 RepID=UPI003D34886F
MIKTLKGKILIGIIGITVIIIIVVNIIIRISVHKKFNDYVINDITTIKNITYNEFIKFNSVENLIYNSKSELLPILNNINSQYNVYISLDKNEKKNLVFIGVELNEKEKMNLIKDCNKKSVIIFTHKEKKDFYATYVYPIYENSKYIATLTIQKRYFNEYLDNKYLVIEIVIAQIILFSIMIFMIYIWTSKSVYSIGKLSKTIGDINNYNELSNTNFNIKGEDEVATLSKQFEKMRIKIVSQVYKLKCENEKVEKLEASRKEFFNCATHEMKTPLTGILGYCELLKNDVLNDKDKYKAYERIEIEGKRLKTMVENMLLIAREKENLKNKPQYFDVVEVLNEVVEEFQIVEKYQKLDYVRNNEFFTILGEEEAIRKIFLNLLDNARKYNKSNIIKIKVYKNEKLTIIIENDCGNIPKEIGDNLFEPFLKYNYGDNKMVSSGLGLFICKNLIEKNGGNIDYKINSGKICFVIIFEK